MKLFKQAEDQLKTLDGYWREPWRQNEGFKTRNAIINKPEPARVVFYHNDTGLEMKIQAMPWPCLYYTSLADGQVIRNKWYWTTHLWEEIYPGHGWKRYAYVFEESKSTTNRKIVRILAFTVAPDGMATQIHTEYHIPKPFKIPYAAIHLDDLKENPE